MFRREQIIISCEIGGKGKCVELFCPNAADTKNMVLAAFDV